jgi:hypothetical protein
VSDPLRVLLGTWLGAMSVAVPYALAAGAPRWLRERRIASAGCSRDRLG